MIESDVLRLGREVLTRSHRKEIPRWLDRRVESIAFEDERTITRIVDFYVRIEDAGEHSFVATNQRTILIPLLKLSRFSSPALEISMKSSEQVSLLSMPTERHLVSSGLHDRWLTKHGVDIPIARILTCISIPRTTVPILTKLRSIPSISRTDWYRTIVDPGMQAVTELIDQVDWESVNRFKKEDYVKKEMLLDIVRWRDQYLAIAEVPTTCFEAGGLAILRCSYRQGTEQGFSIHELGRTILRLAWNILVSPPSTSLSLSVNGVGNSHSSHIVIHAPKGFRAIDGAVEVKYVRYHNRRPLNVKYIDRDRIQSEAHVVLDTEARAIASASAVCKFYPFKTGYIIDSVATAWFLFVVLNAFYSQMKIDNFQLMSGFLNSPLSASVLLFVPAAFGALTTQRDGNRHMSKVFTLNRVLVLASTAVTFWAAMAVAFRLSPSTQAIIWHLCYWISLGVAVRLSLGIIGLWWRSGRLRAWLWQPVGMWRERAALAELRNP